MGYFPSNLIILAGAVVLIAQFLMTGGVSFQIVCAGLAYHHWQEHQHESTGANPGADLRRLLTASAATVAAGLILWLN